MSFQTFCNTVSDNLKRYFFPIAITTIIILTLLSTLLTLLQLYYFHKHVEQDHRPNLQAAIDSLENNPNSTNAEKFETARWKALILLEANALENEYHQRNVTAISRLWISQLAAATGMILTMVGAAIVLRRFKEPEEQEGKAKREFGQVLKASLMTSVPGVIVALIGTLLLFVALRGSQVNMRNQSIYTREWLSQGKDASLQGSQAKP